MTCEITLSCFRFTLKGAGAVAAALDVAAVRPSPAGLIRRAFRPKQNKHISDFNYRDCLLVPKSLPDSYTNNAISLITPKRKQ
jgi:hypothetical protein